MSGISIGMYIMQTLKADAAVTAVCGDRIYPIFCPDGTAAWPLVTYRREHVENDADKDGSGTETVTVTVEVTGDRYADTVTGMEAVRAALVNRSGEYEGGLTVMDCRITDSREDYDLEQGVYGQITEFQFLIN